jgi:hypothetical protein
MATNRLLIVLAAVALASQTEAQVASDAERFRAFVSSLSRGAQNSGESAIAGEDGWMFLTAELRHISAGEFRGDAAAKVSRAGNSRNADPMPAILDFDHQLRHAGIELWIVPVPPKAMIYPSKLDQSIPPGPTRLDPHHAAFYRLLADEGVTVVDLSDKFLTEREQSDLLFCRTDSHWSGAGIMLAAERLAERIKSRDWYSAVSKYKYSVDTREVAIAGDLVRSSPSKLGEVIRLRFVSDAGNRPGSSIEASEDSPVLLLGDSHCLVFHAGGDMHARGAGLADQLAYELGFPMDLIAVRGSGATPARVSLLRKARRDPNYLKAKKLIIWCFSAREFTESDGWAKVPVVERPSQPADGASP